MNISQEKIDNLNAIVKININPEDYQPRVDKGDKRPCKKSKNTGFQTGNGSCVTYQKNVWQKHFG